MVLNRMSNFLEKTLVTIIICSQIIYVLPFSEYITVYRLGVSLALILLIYSIFTKKISITLAEMKQLILLLFIPTMWYLYQVAFFSNTEIFSRAIVYFTLLASGFYVYKTAELNFMLKVLRYFTVINLALALIWLLLGEIQVYKSDNLFTDDALILQIGGIYQKIFGEDGFSYRIAGFTQNPNALAIYGAFGLIGMDFSKLSKWNKVYWVIVYLALFLITQSRAALLFGMSYFIVVYLLRRDIHYVKKIVSITAIILSLVVTNLAIYELRNQNDSDFSSGRLEYIYLVWDEFISNDKAKIYGVGYGNAGEVLQTYFGGSKKTIDNSYLIPLLENGSVGFLVMYTSLLYAIYYSFIKNKDKYSYEKRQRYIAFLSAWFIYSNLELIMFQNSFFHMFIVMYVFYHTELERGSNDISITNT